jgi:hypothetical protein
MKLLLFNTVTVPDDDCEASVVNGSVILTPLRVVTQPYCKMAVHCSKNAALALQVDHNGLSEP